MNQNQQQQPRHRRLIRKNVPWYLKNPRLTANLVVGGSMVFLFGDIFYSIFIKDSINQFTSWLDARKQPLPDLQAPTTTPETTK